ncbi:MAG: 30S ribosomal protein S2 [Nanoarchaeota archaeon]|nr:30S ribosomal protein S2 [Nanoarchaeota archaeon]
MTKIIEKIKEGVKELGRAAEEIAEEVEKTIGSEEIVEDLAEEVEKITDSKEETIEKAAEEESLKTEKAPEKSIEEKKKEILKKARKLSEKIDAPKTEDLKEQVKIKKRTDMLIPLEEYVKSGIYLGTRVVTPSMKPFVYRRRADGLAIFNTDLIDEKIKEGIEYLSKFNAEDIILVCKRQAGERTAEMFSKLTGIRVFTKKYPAGILTNTNLPDFFENELTIITDHWLDKNALNDTLKVHKKVLMICDTNNFAKGAHQVIIGNNKSPKSLGVIFYLLASGFCKAKKIKADIPDLEWWTGEK